MIAYDDSDGFYDHDAPPILNYDGENVPGPVVDGQQWPGDQCAPPVPDTGQTVDPNTRRCGPRLPFLLLSPAVKANTVDPLAAQDKLDPADDRGSFHRRAADRRRVV